MYAIVIYDESGQPDYLPMSWLVREVNLAQVILKKSLVEFFYPPNESEKPSAVSLAKKRCATPETSWMRYLVRILGTAGKNKLHSRKAIML